MYDIIQNYRERKLRVTKALSVHQKQYLKGLAHELKPVVMVGQRGISPQLLESAEQALLAHELIKVKFVENKEKPYKQAVTEQLSRETGAWIVGMIGHVSILYRPHPEPDRRRIRLP